MSTETNAPTRTKSWFSIAAAAFLIALFALASACSSSDDEGGNSNGDDRWKEEDVLRILLDPVYTMGSNPTVDDDQWLNAQKKLLAEQGEEEYFRRPEGGTTWQHAGTFMHELGHNLALGHGGDDDVNQKPNYLSIMNKPFQLQGLRKIDGNGEAQDGLFDYSRQQIDLDENAINESLGLGPTAPGSLATTWFRFDKQHWTTDPPPEGSAGPGSAGPVNGAIDWNNDGFILPIAISIDVTDDGDTTLLEGYDDWSNLVFTGGRVGGGAALPLPQVTEIGEELTLQEAQRLGLAPPTKLHGHVADQQKIVLTWKPVGPKKEASYKIYRSLPGGEPVLIGSTDESNFEDTDVVAGVTYSYLVTVVNALGVESAQAATVHVEFPQ